MPDLFIELLREALLEERETRAWGRALDNAIASGDEPSYDGPAHTFDHGGAE